MRGRRTALFVTAVFLGLLWLPLVGGVVGLQSLSDSGEKRTLASWPSLSVLTDEGLEVFRDQFEASINDHFGFRTLLIRTYNRLMVGLFGTSGVPKVTVGKDGWLYYTDSVDNYFYQRPYKKKDLEVFARVLEERQRWLAERGSHFVFIVAPDKVSIYPEHLPAARRAQTRLGPRNMDRVLDYLRQQGTFPVVDLRERFAKAKQHGRLYHHIDTHWNDLGAFLAYQELITVFGEMPLGDDDVVIRKVPQQYGDLAKLLNLLGVFDEQVVRVGPKQKMPIKKINRKFAASRGWL